MLTFNRESESSIRDLIEFLHIKVDVLRDQTDLLVNDSFDLNLDRCQYLTTLPPF